MTPGGTRRECGRARRPGGGCCGPRSGPVRRTRSSARDPLGSAAAGRARVGPARGPAGRAARAPSGSSVGDRCPPRSPDGRSRRPAGRCRSLVPPQPREAALGRGDAAHHGGRPVGETASASVHGHKWVSQGMPRESRRIRGKSLHQVVAPTHGRDRFVVRNPPTWQLGHSLGPGASAKKDPPRSARRPRRRPDPMALQSGRCRCGTGSARVGAAVPGPNQAACPASASRIALHPPVGAGGQRRIDAGGDRRNPMHAALMMMSRRGRTGRGATLSGSLPVQVRCRGVAVAVGAGGFDQAHGLLAAARGREVLVIRVKSA